MSCRHLSRSAGRAPLWRLALCPSCRKARRVDSRIGFALVCRKAATAPQDGLRRTLAALELPYPIPSPRRERVGRTLRRARRPTAIVLSGLAMLSYAWLRYIDIDPEIEIPARAVTHPSANDDFDEAARLIRVEVLVNRMMTQLSKRRSDAGKGVSKHTAGQWAAEVAAIPGAMMGGGPTPTATSNLAPIEHEYTLAELDDALRINKPALDAARRGLAGTYVAPPRRAYEDTSKYMQSLRSIGRLLCFASRVHAAHQRWEQAADSALEGVEFGVNIQRQGDTWFSSIGDACEAMGRSALWDIVDKLSASAARQAAHRLERADQSRPSLADVLTEEKRFMLSANLEEMRKPGWRWTSWGPDGNHFYPEVFLSNLPYSKTRLIRLCEGRMDYEIEKAKQPYSRPIGQDEDLSSLPLFLQSMTPSYGYVRFNECVDVAENRLLATALALRAYKQDHGAYPTSLTFLEPHDISQIPRDPFSIGGLALGYRLSGTTYVLWSVGPDGADQSGQAINDPKANNGNNPTMVQQGSSGDIVAGVNRT